LLKGGDREMKHILWIGVFLMVAQGDSRSRLDEPFSLAIGETARLDDAGLSLTFLDVTRDSRCPKEVSCIVAGSAIIRFDAVVDGEKTTLTFEIPPGGEDAQSLAGLTVTLTALEPEPEAGKKMERSSYVAKLVVAATTRGEVNVASSAQRGPT